MNPSFVLILKSWDMCVPAHLIFVLFILLLRIESQLYKYYFCAYYINEMISPCLNWISLLSKMHCSISCYAIETHNQHTSLNKTVPHHIPNSLSFTVTVTLKASGSWKF